MYRKPPVGRITGTTSITGAGPVGGGKPDRFIPQKLARIGKEYKFYHYDEPHAYILQYRRDCTRISNTKGNCDKGPLEEFTKTILKDAVHAENDSQSQNKTPPPPPEYSDLTQLYTSETNNSQTQGSISSDARNKKSSLINTTNRHMWVNTTVPVGSRNMLSIKFSNLDINTPNMNHSKQKLTKKESLTPKRMTDSRSSRPCSGKSIIGINNPSNNNNNTNSSNQQSIIPPKDNITAKLKSESNTQEANLNQPIHNASHPGFWPLLYKKLLQLQADLYGITTEDEK
ncbi:unnamed protein product [Trichobilharzia szidati]|nr:unnamed protein product [Trichobilharzia szidati]